MSKFIPLSVPNLKGNELKYVTDAIEQEWVSTGGEYINKFEEEIARYTKVNGAVACQSGTAGIHLALLLSGVNVGDEVIVPTLTFIAAVNPIKYAGAEPIFMDCDETFSVDGDKLTKFCEEECTLTHKGLVNNESKKIIRAIVVVHIFGNLANLDKIIEVANKYKLKVIEDATEALGSYYIDGIYKGRYAGTIGDFGVYSFNGNKIITTGGGGALLAKEYEDLKKAKYLSTQAKDDELKFIHDNIGFNYRMTNIQAAIGLGQLEKLEEFIETKKENYNLYRDLLEEVKGVKLLPFKEGIRPNYWFYPLEINYKETDITVDNLIQSLGKYKIQARPVWELIHKQKPYKNCKTYKINQAKAYQENIINIPCSSNLQKEDVYFVVKCIKEILGGGN